MRVFLDANVLFSAAKSDGAVRALLRLLLERGHECWADAYVVAEARRNLEAKGHRALQTLDALLAHLRVSPARSRSGGESEDAAVAWLPEKDRPVLAAAIALGCDALVTGDRTHFGAGYGRVYGGVTVHSPRSLAPRARGDLIAPRAPAVREREVDEGLARGLLAGSTAITSSGRILK